MSSLGCKNTVGGNWMGEKKKKKTHKTTKNPNQPSEKSTPIGVDRIEGSG